VGPGLTLDTGFLIGLERSHFAARKALLAARELKVRLTVPAAVLAAWWRGQDEHVGRVLDGVIVEPLTRDLALSAGWLRAEVGGGASVVDAIVVASAAVHGDVVPTSDPEDLEALARYGSVRVDQV
jgi:predicted nucleic acid-binding protein